MKPIAALLLALGLAPSARAGLPDAPPESVGLDPARLARIDRALERAVRSKSVPGAVALVVRDGKVAYAKAVGERAVGPEPEPMTRDTAFDLASLTKPVATATAVMILLERGELRLDQTVGELLPDHGNGGKGPITVEQLLRHRSGLIADNPIADYADGPERARERIANLGLVHPPGERFLYSDVNYLILGRIVEKLSGQPLDAFAAEHIFRPLETEFHFRTEGCGDPTVPAERIAPTEPADGVMLRGTVHDPRARALGGVAGHAGLFGTADDLAVFARTLLDGGRAPNGHRLLAPATVRLMTSPGDTPDGQRRGLGWDVATGFSAPKGALFGPSSFGHTGFTGTSLWIDPETRTAVVLLTSRLHPDGKGSSPAALRREVATLAAAAIADDGSGEVRDAPPALRPVTPGVDVLIRREFEGLKGRRVGLVTNHTGLTSDGRSTIDVLHEAEGVELVALFSPEHGIRGQVDREVDDSRDDKTGLPIYSLYGKARKPTPERLVGVDVLVYDIQDIGTRFYTYISTLGLVLEAAQERSIPVVVLDRPNPIGGLAVAGPVRDEGFESFIAFHPIPVVHGMTVGELAKMFNAERAIDAELAVVPCEGWRRGDLYDRSGLLWTNPSPNMRSLTQAIVYPGPGLLEATNLATGRGTDTPFERVGAPWIDPRAWSEALNRAGLPGVRFTPVRFTPSERQYAGEECGGVYIMITDRAAFEPVALGIEMAVTLRRLYPDQWKPAELEKFLADRDAFRAIVEGRPRAEVEAGWRAELEEFRARRAQHLIYPE